MGTDFDIIVVGAGIAGSSAACYLADGFKVALIEREAAPGYHATGRSAAIFSELYGNDPVRALSRASRDFLFNPPPGFAEVPLVGPRGILFVGREDQAEALDRVTAALGTGGAARRLSGAEACAAVPLLRPDYVAGAILETGASDIDVDALHAGFLRLFKAHGGQVVVKAALSAAERKAGRWRVETTAGTFTAEILVNAAGAWADELAVLAGARPRRISPLQRTALIVDAPAGMAVQHWPMTVDIDEQFYFKPEAGRILMSPADETPVAPCDAQPDEYDVAVAVDRVERATMLSVRHIFRKWAGLRSFAPDRTPVVGYDEEIEDFFWLAGQGGYGVQTAPAMARVADALVRLRPLPADLARQGLEPAALSPARGALR